MSQTVAGSLIDVLEKVGVKQIFGLIGDSLNLTAAQPATVKTNGSASVARIGQRSIANPRRIGGFARSIVNLSFPVCSTVCRL